MNCIQERLFALQDLAYKKFMERLVPTVSKDTVIGVRLPQLRKMAREISRTKEAEEFLAQLPHKFFEENHLHSFLVDLSSKKFDEAVQKSEEFLPYIDNWAVCDSFRPKSLKKDPDALYCKVKEWMCSDNTYTIRWSLVLQLNWFLEEHFHPEMLERVSKIQSEDYYVNMAISWYYSMALVKQYEATIPMFQKRVLPFWIHNQSLQKALESKQIDPTRKKELRSLKMSRVPGGFLMQ